MWWMSCGSGWSGLGEIQANVRINLPEGVDSLDHGQVLFDGNGLPG